MSGTSDDLPRMFVEGAGLIYDEEGNVVGQEPLRVMSPENIKEREALNRANTSEVMRQRTLRYEAKSNGYRQNAESLDDRCTATKRGTRCTLKINHQGYHINTHDEPFDYSD